MLAIAVRHAKRMGRSFNITNHDELHYDKHGLSQ